MLFHVVEALASKNRFMPIEVVLLEDIPRLRLASFDFPPSKKGDRIELPLWLVGVLEKHGLVAIDSEKEFMWLGRVHWREKVQPPKGTLSLSKLPEDFYPRALNILQILASHLSDPVVRQKLSQAENLFRDVVKRRMHVLSEMSQLEGLDSSTLGNLTFEEQLLLNLLKDVLNRWVDEVARFGFASSEG